MQRLVKVTHSTGILSRCAFPRRLHFERFPQGMDGRLDQSRGFVPFSKLALEQLIRRFLAVWKGYQVMG